MPSKVHSRPRTFKIVRLKDVSGVSGEGVVAEGVVFHDGQAVLSWFGRLHTIEVSPDIDTMMEVHGHQGKTIIQWD